jgi:hypothetical protein
MPLDPAEAAKIAAAAIGGSAYQGPNKWYLELTSDVPDSGTLGTPVEYTGYLGPVEFAAADWDADGAGKLTNDAAIDFGEPTDGSDTAVAVEAYDDAQKTNRIWYEELDAPLDIDDGLDAVEFPIGGLSVTFGSSSV